MRILIVAGMVLFRLRFPRCQSDTLNQQRAGDHLLLPGYFVGRSLLPVIFTRIFRIGRHWLLHWPQCFFSHAAASTASKAKASRRAEGGGAQAGDDAGARFAQQG